MVISTEEIVASAILFCWVIFVVVFLTKNLYEIMRRRRLKYNVAVYYDRKVIHMLTGGLVAMLVPFIFKTPLIPLILALLLGVFTYIPHKTGKLMYWFQTEENMYEVSFCIMWGGHLNIRMANIGRQLLVWSSSSSLHVIRRCNNGHCQKYAL